MSDKTTTLAQLGERELLVLLDALDSLVAALDSTSLDETRYVWSDIARMRERVLSARRRLR